MAWFCIATNTLAIVPAKILWDKDFVGDSLFTGLTGLASLLYHGNELDGWEMNQVGIRNTDIVLADLMVLHTVHLLIKSEIRWECSIVALPFVVYSAELSLLVRFCTMIAYGSVCIVWILIHKQRYDLRWVLAGILLILSELVSFFFGNKSNYVWLHGVHHVSAFLSQYCMVRSIKK
tara:strand:+ start:756 stop:1286 length:531 start_codon:yes stop_codon:yes gene_type:complete